ncbi:GRAM domain-containing protein 2B-like isoform X2 [Leguminivora glycinivorella]|uniref:GRAM domain-containing protein 2B-like isoform X2 n=1 Tax=Leguminivora glycinivorella TaxID=1035111 RepID=UPI00200BC1D8|nr:GRAM domain-containing protein 2B-like isoform X2 [Leguminivora glycinivorella]
MKESYPDEIMLCFVQGFGNGCEHGYNKSREITECNENAGLRLSKRRSQAKKVSLQVQTNLEVIDSVEDVELRPKKSQSLVTGKSLRLSSGDRLLRLPEVKRSLSDRFSVITDANGKRPSKNLLTIRKTWSTGNFASGAAGGGCGAPRSAPATPLQLDPHPRTKHDKHVVKPLSGSAPSVRVPADAVEAEGGSKQPSKSRQKKFQRHFPQVGPEERVLNYYSCALVGDLLLQGHLYITKNYFAFYSNVFGYVTKLLIPTTSVLRITKEKVARIIPNAVGVCTRDERHVFGSLLSRDSTYKLMTHVWKAARIPERAPPTPQDLRASEVELDATDSPEDDSSSAGGDHTPAPPVRRESEAIITSAGAAVIQPALLTGAPLPRRAARCGRLLLLLLALLLACSAALLAYRLHRVTQDEDPLSALSGEQLYGELVRWRARLHGRAASELHAFLTTNLLLLTKVRQSLEALSGVILTDMAHTTMNDVPNETAFS